MRCVSMVYRVRSCAWKICRKKHSDRRRVCMNKFVFKANNIKNKF